MSDISTNSEIVNVRVQRLLPFGILVSLEDGTVGLIREREIAWGQKQRRHWRQRVRVGDTLQAVLLGERLDQRLELSLRLIESDPWVGLDKRHPLGQLIEGTVTGVQPYGVFVEIEPGVSGLLHMMRLPLWARRQDASDLFWVGDRVKVVVERIDLKHRQIGLSLGRAWNQRWQVAPLEDSAGQRRGGIAGAEMGGHRLEDTADLALPPVRIMIVEDDQAQLSAIVKWMRKAGLEPITAASAEAALALLESSQPDLVLSDFGLPLMSGVEALQQIRSRWPAIRCALMIDWTRLSEHPDAIEALSNTGVQLLTKPLLPADIVDLLAAESEVNSEAAPLPEIAIQASAGLPPPQVSSRQRIVGHLGRLCSATGAEKAVLFQLDPDRRVVAILADAGASALNLDARADLLHSPVRDVAEDQQTFHVANARQLEARVRYLRPLLDFVSCLGVPLPVSLSERYALFVFSLRANAFSDLHTQYLDAVALAIGAELEREQFQLRALDLQRLALLGQLSRALVHEINHQLSPINFVLSDIKRQVNALAADLNRSPQAADDAVRELQETVVDLAKGVWSLTEVTRMFGRMTAQAREQAVDVDLMIDEVIYPLRDMADRAHIRLSANVPDDLPPIYLQVVLLQQILLNIIVNAIQQIELLRPEIGGRVQIDVTILTREERPLIQIRIEDDGPGIHRQLWERIFDLGFTTRAEGGSGLGLYITRSLAEALGVRVAIAESFILWGTAFVVELPVTS